MLFPDGIYVACKGTKEVSYLRGPGYGHHLKPVHHRPTRRAADAGDALPGGAAGAGHVPDGDAADPLAEAAADGLGLTKGGSPGRIRGSA